MKALKHIVFFITLTSFLASCEREDPPELPPATMEGLNTFGALVNGNVWVADPVIPVDHLNAYYSTQAFVAGGNQIYPAFLFRIEAAGSIGSRLLDYDNFYLAVDSVIGEGLYHFDSVLVDSNGLHSDLPTFYEDGLTERAYREIGHFNSLNITRYDTIQNIISGTFQLELSSQEGQTLKITEGRFDVTYIPNTP